MIAVAREDENTLRLHIIPKKMKDDGNPALSTPLSYTGTPEELDSELGKHLTSFVECHAQLGSTLAQAKAEMEAAAKAVQEEARKNAVERSKKDKPTVKTETAAPAPSDTVAAPPAASMTLFGDQQAGATPPSATTRTMTAARQGGGRQEGGGGGESTCRLAL